MHKVDNEFERKMVADYLQRKAAKIPNEAMDSVANQESNNANLWYALIIFFISHGYKSLSLHVRYEWLKKSKEITATFWKT